MSLQELGIASRAGKAVHNYLGYLESYLAPIRSSASAVLELGIAEGGSLLMWEQYFPTARIVGVDILPECIKPFSRALAVLVRDGDLEDLLLKLGGQTFDVIIDDASHNYQNTRSYFYALWPCLKPGGFYIIEDLHTSYQEGYGHAPSTVEYLKGMIDDLNHHGKLTVSKKIDGSEAGLTAWEKAFEFIHFYPYLAVLKKWS